MAEFIVELQELINKHSKENDSNTPDFILARYIKSCLQAYETAIDSRDKWYGENRDPDYLYLAGREL